MEKFKIGDLVKYIQERGGSTQLPLKRGDIVEVTKISDTTVNVKRGTDECCNSNPAHYQLYQSINYIELCEIF